MVNKLKPSRKSQLKIVGGTTMILAGFILGPLPIFPGIGLILGGAALYVSAKPDGWRFPEYIDKRIPKKIRHILYTDLRTGETHIRPSKRKASRKLKD